MKRNIKTIKFDWLEEKWELGFNIGKYTNNGRIYIGVLDKKGASFECFSDLTINIPMYLFEEDSEIIINNDAPIELIDLLVKMNILVDTYKFAYSGYSRYKVMRFNKENAREYIVEEY